MESYSLLELLQQIGLDSPLTELLVTIITGVAYFIGRRSGSNSTSKHP